MPRSIAFDSDSASEEIRTARRQQQDEAFQRAMLAASTPLTRRPDAQHRGPSLNRALLPFLPRRLNQRESKNTLQDPRGRGGRQLPGKGGRRIAYSRVLLCKVIHSVV